MTTVVDLPSLEDWPTLGDDGESELHWYPVYTSRAQVGDRALCGHIKRAPAPSPSNAAARSAGLPLCEFCDRLAKERGQ